MSDFNQVEGKYLTLQGKPLLRENNIFCYGDTNDAHILFLVVISEKEVTISGSQKKVKIPDKVLAQVLSTDFSKPPYERVVKQFEKNGLYEAFDIGSFWLNQLNQQPA